MLKRELQEFAIMLVPIIDYLKNSDEFEGTFEEYLDENFTPEFVRDFHENKAILEQLIIEFYDEKEKEEKEKKDKLHYT